MIKKLRIRFIVIAMAAIVIVLAVILSGIYVVSRKNIANYSDKVLMILAKNDGAFPKEIRTNTRYGYSAVILADNLAPGEHMLSIQVPEGENPVHLAYLLTAGGSRNGGSPVPGKKFTSRLVTEPLPAEVWELSGPYGAEHLCVNGPTPALNTV